MFLQFSFKTKMDDQAVREESTIRRDIACVVISMEVLAAKQAKTVHEETAPKAAFIIEDGAAIESKEIQRYVARLAASVIPMFMLLWITHAGFELATEPRRDPRYNSLALAVGVISIVFGLIYFINGVAIVACLVLELVGWQQRKNKKTDFHGGGNSDANHFV